MVQHLKIKRALLGSASSTAHSSDDAATCGSPYWIGKGLTCVCFKPKGNCQPICITLTPLQEERLRRLKCRMKVYFDASKLDHQDALRALWSASFPGHELKSLISDQWKEMGWQGRDPSTDFRGAGFISLENLLFFAKTFSVSILTSHNLFKMEPLQLDLRCSRLQSVRLRTSPMDFSEYNIIFYGPNELVLLTSFQNLLMKQGRKGVVFEYPFAVAGVNITFMIMQMLDLDAATKPRTFIRTVFLQMLSENEWAFDLLYCVAFVVMDKQWLETNATYMQFNDILKSTRVQLEKELMIDDVLRIEDMPSYSLLS